MEEALRLIIAKSSNAANEAIMTLRAIRAKSPVVHIRYEHTLQLALNDPGAQFTPEERQILAAAIDGPDGNRDFTERFRVNKEERAHLAEAAEAAGQTKSDYIRSRLFD